MRYGSQTPTFEVVGEYESSAGADAVELFGAYGVDFYPCQRRELELFLARDEAGRFATRTIGISKPRQNGKSFAVQWYAIWMALIHGADVLYTAHHGDAVRNMFSAMCDAFEIDELRGELARPKGIRKAPMEITLANGGRIGFAIRTASSTRSGTHDIIVIDEAQELTDFEQDSLKPTTIAAESGDPQMIYLGTPPNAKCNGTVFRTLHDRAHDGTGGSAWWLEWAADEIGDAMDVDRWYACNPAMGYKIREDVMEDAAATSSPDGFAREYLGWWAAPAEGGAALPGAIAEGDWERCAVDDPEPGGAVSYAVKFSPDGMLGALCACARYDGAPPHVELVEVYPCGHSVKAIAEWLAPRAGGCVQIAIDGKAKVDALERRLTDAEVPARLIRRLASSEVVSACSMFADAAESGQVTHWGDDGQSALDESVTRCPRRAIGRAGGWAFEDAPDGTPGIIAEAAALAYWSAVTCKRNPRRKLRIG